MPTRSNGALRELRRELAAGLEQRGEVGARLAVAAEARRRRRAARRSGAGRRAGGRRSTCARRTSTPGTGTGIDSSRRTIGSSSIGSNQDGSSSPSGATGTTPARRTSPGCSASRSARQPPSEVPATTTGSLVRPSSRRGRAANASSCGSTAPSCRRRRLAEAGQVDGDRAPAARAELRQQRAPGVGRVAPAVQQHDPGPAAVDLERARGVSGDLDPVLEDGLSCPRDIPLHRPSWTRSVNYVGRVSELRPRSTEPAQEPPAGLLGAAARRPAAGARARRSGRRRVPRAGRRGVGRPAPAGLRHRPARRSRRWRAGVMSTWRASRAPRPASAGSSRWCPDLVGARVDRSRGSCSSSRRAYGFDPHDPMRPAELLVLNGLYDDPGGGAGGAGRRWACRWPRHYVGGKLQRDEALALKLVDDGRQDERARSSPAG